jgi:hypothetical protein
MKLKTLDECRPGDIVYLRPAAKKYETKHVAIVVAVLETGTPAGHTNAHGIIVPSARPVLVERLPAHYDNAESDDYSVRFLNSDHRVARMSLYPGYLAAELISIDTAASTVVYSRSHVRAWARTPAIGALLSNKIDAINAVLKHKL